MALDWLSEFYFQSIGQSFIKFCILFPIVDWKLHTVKCRLESKCYAASTVCYSKSRIFKLLNISVLGRRTEILSNLWPLKYEQRYVIFNNVAFWRVYIRASLCSLLLNSVTPMLFSHLLIQATSKGSDQIGWSEALLVAHTTLLEISCRGSIYTIDSQYTNVDWSTD